MVYDDRSSTILRSIVSAIAGLALGSFIVVAINQRVDRSRIDALEEQVKQLREK